MNVANEKLYNLRNSVQIFYIHRDDLRPVERTPEKTPAMHAILMDFDNGDDMIEVMLLNDFYLKVLPDLGLHEIANESKQVAYLNSLFNKIGALSTNYNA